MLPLYGPRFFDQPERIVLVAASLLCRPMLKCMKYCVRKAVVGLVCTACFLHTGNAFASELLPADSNMVDIIDQSIHAGLESRGLTAIPPADPLTVLRRTTLDLAGRIPTTTEREWFVSLPEADQRRELVDRLMDLPDFDFHHRNWLNETLLPNQPYNDEFRSYLLAAVQGRRSWDTMFREMLQAQPAEAPENGAAQFLRSRVRDLDDLTNDSAILFFGVNISCAKCHDHPLVSDWKQDHFYGMQTFFKRTYETRRAHSLAERPFGEVQFATVGGESKTAAFMFLTGETTPDRTPQMADDEKKKLEERVRKLENEDAEAEIYVPEFRPRDELVELALRDSRNHFFARNIVNRVWARFLGTGLVNPLDQMHSGNPSIQPELLEWLANDLIAHGYDLRRLIRGIVLSEVYARSSEWTSESEPPAAETFAVARTRPLTPRQLAASLIVAVQNPEKWPAIDQAEEWMKRRTDLENQSDGWVPQFEQPTENFQLAVDEALFFNNNHRVQNDLLRDTADRLLGSLKKNDDLQKQLEQLWLAVLCRTPLPEETESATVWLGRDPAQKDESRKQLLWALLAGPEFRFNH